MTNQQLQRLRELSFKHLDDSLTEQDLANLEEILQDNEALREFVALLTLHSRLALVMGNFGSTTIPSENSSDAQLAANNLRELSLPDSVQSNRWQSLRKPLLLVAALAACLWGVFVLLPSPDSSQNRSIARVIEKIDCNRESERWLTTNTSGIEAGEVINLDLGLIVIEFDEGARVTLEGPSQFEVVSANRGFLHAGRLTALVPKRAQGFTVGTPSCDSVDLGTEFGLQVFNDGSAETHVFEGEVVLKNISQEDSDSDDSYHLTTSMAARVEASTRSVSRVEARPAVFTRVNYEDDRIQTANALSSQIPRSKQLALWLDAARNVQKDERGKVSSWGDLLYDDNVKKEDAWQVLSGKRPQLIEDGLAGKPSIRFDGKSHLVTAPINTLNDVTVFCVFAYRDHPIKQKKSEMLINFNGPPNLVIERNWQKKLAGRMYQGWANGTFHHGSWLIAPKTASEVPQLAAYIYDHTNNRSELHINGKLVDSGKASAPAAIHSPKFIGKNRDPNRSDHFVGDISEILIFNSAFSGPDCARASQYFLEKYEIEVTPSVELEGNEPHDET